MMLSATMDAADSTPKPSNLLQFVPDAAWREKLIQWGRPAHPTACVANCRLALRESPDWAGVLAYDDFAHAIRIKRPTPWGKPIAERWTEQDDGLLADWFQHAGINVGVSTAAESVRIVARENTYSPLFEWLNDLEWDGQARIHNWLSKYLGVKFDPYSQAVGRAWLISAVARAFHPGSKADCCLILEGNQGIGKSESLRALAGPEFFTDLRENLASKEAAQLCTGAWIVELSELESVQRSNIGVVKSFLSRREDRFRPPYGRYVVSVPRQCVFAGTTNAITWYQDETGGRRFWPVRCSRLYIDGLAMQRAQIWAEAVAAYRGAEQWWLDEATERLAAVEQSARCERDPWESPIAKWLATRADAEIAEILKMLGKDTREQTHYDQIRVGRVLAHLGWVRYRLNSGTRGYRYRNPA